MLQLHVLPLQFPFGQSFNSQTNGLNKIQLNKYEEINLAGAVLVSPHEISVEVEVSVDVEVGGLVEAVIVVENVDFLKFSVGMCARFERETIVD